MSKPSAKNGDKNLIGKNRVKLREQHKLSQRMLAYALQARGLDVDKNVITRIELQQRYVSDIEIKAFMDLFEVTF